jgi:hypothetical protein
MSSNYNSCKPIQQQVGHLYWISLNWCKWLAKKELTTFSNKTLWIWNSKNTSVCCVTFYVLNGKGAGTDVESRDFKNIISWSRLSTSKQACITPRLPRLRSDRGRAGSYHSFSFFIWTRSMLTLLIRNVAEWIAASLPLSPIPAAALRP